MIKLLQRLALAVPLIATAPLQSQTPVNWDALSSEATTILSDYLRINTTNPPGNELAGAKFLKAILEREGIEAQILDTVELGAGRANLYARLKGNGSKKAIALVHHIDVVTADTGVLGGRSVRGRCKGRIRMGARRTRHEGSGRSSPDGDARPEAQPASPSTATSSTSATPTRSSAPRVRLTFVDRHADLLRDVEYLVTEGGENSLDADGKRCLLRRRRSREENVLAGPDSERHAFPWFASHQAESRPAAGRRAGQNRALRDAAPRDAGSREILPRHRANYTGERRAWLSNVKSALGNPRARSWILSDVYWNAILRNTISLTAPAGIEQDQRHSA